MRLRRLIIVVAVVSGLMVPLSAGAADKWQGTDDLVSQKINQVAGVTPRKPLIDLSQGNLGLFVFALGGFAAGSIVGYQWRKMFGEKAGKSND